MRYLVTGGAGFIGSHLVEALCHSGEEVHVLDDLSTGYASNIQPYQGQIRFFEGDLGEPLVLERALEGVDYVLHQAALVSVPRSIKEPLAAHRINVSGTLQLLEGARQAGVKRVVLASSSAIYGENEKLPLDEKEPPQPLSPYAANKRMGEEYAALYSSCFGLETVALRYFNVFGPRQDPRSPYAAVIPRFLEALLAASSPVIFGDGQQTRDFCYVGDVVQANLAACHTPHISGKVFNIASGQRISLLLLIETLQNLTNSRIEARFEPPRPGDIRHSGASIEEARQMLGYSPQTSLAQGLKQTVDWFSQHPATTTASPPQP